MLKAELGPAAPGPLHHCQAEDHGVGLFLLGWSPLPSPGSPPHTHLTPSPRASGALSGGQGHCRGLGSRPWYSCLSAVGHTQRGPGLGWGLLVLASIDLPCLCRNVPYPCVTDKLASPQTTVL